MFESNKKKELGYIREGLLQGPQELRCSSPMFEI